MHSILIYSNESEQCLKLRLQFIVFDTPYLFYSPHGIFPILNEQIVNPHEDRLIDINLFLSNPNFLIELPPQNFHIYRLLGRRRITDGSRHPLTTPRLSLPFMLFPERVQLLPQLFHFLLLFLDPPLPGCLKHGIFFRPPRLIRIPNVRGLGPGDFGGWEVQFVSPFGRGVGWAH